MNRPSPTIPLGLKGLVPAMLGGLNSVGGAAVGAVFVAVVESMVVLYLGADWSNLVVFAILLLVLALRHVGTGRVHCQHES